MVLRFWIIFEKKVDLGDSSTSLHHEAVARRIARLSHEGTYNNVCHVHRTCQLYSGGVDHRKTDLVAIAPGVGLCADIHVGILDSFFQGRHVIPMFPVLIPQILRVERSYYQGRYNHTASCEPPCLPADVFGVQY